tara:strand:- start:173 stop:1111 length:939 start_codon:yes stop_codon:yes gene_type:complete
MNKNLVVKISNGFGNQMFLYAAAYGFSKKLGYNLLIDNETGVMQDLKKWNKKKRINWKPKYELEIFNLRAGIAENKYKLGYTKRKFIKFLDHFSTKKNFLIEQRNKDKKTQYSDHYLKQKYSETIYPEGYFESENYFRDYRNHLLEEFSFKSNPDLKDNVFKKIIDSSNVVSIAFRSKRYLEFLSDYKDAKKVKKTSDFENLAVKYIYRGVEYFKSKIANPKFLIWSDDFENLDNYFDPKIFTFVKNDINNKIILDFFLMRQCKYFIVGPTSFHWWSAWLCDDKKKIIIRPKDSELNVSSNINFWPESWIKI